MAWWIALFFALPVFNGFAQSTLKNLRYDEDYSHLRNDTSSGFYRHMKYVEIGSLNSAYLSLGGEVRYQVQYMGNENWGEIAEPYHAVYSRFLFHSDLHFDKGVRFFAQLNSTAVTGKPSPPIDVDENRLDIQQSFIEIHPPGNFATSSSLGVRLGRQELVYGSQRLISVREGPNNRLSFDAFKILTRYKRMALDVFYAHPVEIRIKGFDRYFNSGKKIWGVYAVLNQTIAASDADVYYIGYNNCSASFDAGSGEEVRHSFGARLFTDGDSWKYDLEVVYQFGNLSQKEIRAFTASANVAYRFREFDRSVLLGGKVDLVSGDRFREDDVLNTFNPLFPRGAYFGLAALIGPANLLDLHPYIEKEISSRISLTLDYDLFWRYSTEDGIYGPDGELLHYGDGARSKIGNQLGLSMEYEPDPHLVIAWEFTWFETSSFLKETTPGRDVIFSALTLRARF